MLIRNWLSGLIVRLKASRLWKKRVLKKGSDPLRASLFLNPNDALQRVRPLFQHVTGNKHWRRRGKRQPLADAIQVLEARQMLTPLAAVNDTFSVAEPASGAPTPVTLDVLANDTGGTGTLSISSVGTVSNGSVSVQSPSSGNSHETLLFTPSSGFFGSESLSYTVTDSAGDSSSATVSVIVSSGDGVTQPPVGASNTVNTSDYTPYTFAESDFKFSDPYNLPANTLTDVEITTLPTSGTLTDNGTAVTAGQFVSVSDVSAGNLFYTPPSSGSGVFDDSFTFQVQDSGSTANGGVNLDPTPKTMTIDVQPELPTVATAATASATQVTGTSVNLSVLGADAAGESTLTYSWAVTSQPDGAYPWIFQSGDNDAKNTTVSFNQAGNYTFQVTIANAQGESVTSSVSVSVVSTVSSISVWLPNESLNPSQSEQAYFTVYDQFWNQMSSPPPITWSVMGWGTITSGGMYTAPNGNTSDTIVASCDGIEGSTWVSVWAPPPEIDDLSTSSGSMSGGTSVTITGSGFTGATSVMFGDVAATSFTVNNDGSITAVSPAESAGSVDVTVTTQYGESWMTSSDQFTYLGTAPTVTGLSTTTGPAIGGTSVTITGTNFTGATQVNFGGIPATDLVVNSPTSITVTSPAGFAGSWGMSVDVVVETPLGTSGASWSDQFTYWSPMIYGLSTSAGSVAGGTTLTIYGGNLQNATAVDFGNTSVTNFTQGSDGSITVVAPAGAAGDTNVSVVTVNGTSNATTYTYVNPPTVTGLSVASGPTAGWNDVIITGTNLVSPDGTNTVMFGNVAADVMYSTNNSVDVYVPSESAGTVDVTVSTEGGTSATSTADHYTFVAIPTVTGLSTSAGPAVGGTSVTITGVNFTGATEVDFGGVPATNLVVNSSTSITVTSPAGSAGSWGSGSNVDVTVTTPLGTSATNWSDQFTYWTPQVNNLSTSAGPVSGGTTLTIYGTNLQGATAVDFGNTSVTSFTQGSDGSIAVVVPAGAAGDTNVTVVTVNGTSNATTFTYVNPPTITGLSETSGSAAGGDYITITGTNLVSPDGTANVMFGNVSASMWWGAGNAIYAYTPSANAGTVDVTVTTEGGTSATSSADRYTFLALPTVTGLSTYSGPANGGTSVTITGANFTGATEVDFGGTPAANLIVNSSTSITVTSPAGSAGSSGMGSSVDVTVVTPLGTSVSNWSEQFTYWSPEVFGLSTSSGPTSGGTTLTIYGSNLQDATAVDFGNTSITNFTQGSDGSISLVAPAGTVGDTNVSVVTVNGTSNATTFTYANPPTVTGLSVISGPTVGGNYLAITGTNLVSPDGSNTVMFGNVSASSWYTMGNTIYATAPAGNAGTVDVTVTTVGGTSATSSADQYTYQVITQPPSGMSNEVITSIDSSYVFAASDFGFSDWNNSPSNSFAGVIMSTLPYEGTLFDAGSAVQPGQFVSIADINSGKLLYTPTPSSSGDEFDNFSFQVESTGSTANGGVNIDPYPKWMSVYVQIPELWIENAATASASTVTGTTVNLSTLGGDSSGESTLTYTWGSFERPAGATPTFSVNGTNAAKNTTVTFNEPGNYTFGVTIADQMGATVTDLVSVTVVQAAASIVVGYDRLLMAPSQSAQFGAVVYDQFGNVMSNGASLNWSASEGTIDASGYYTSSSDFTGTATITATYGSASGSLNVTVTTLPVIESATLATNNPTSGPTDILFTTADDPYGESTLTYTWEVAGEPAGANPTFSDNGTNSAKATTVTFDKAGYYVFYVYVSDPSGNTVMSSVDVTVTQVLTSLSVTPAVSALNSSQSEQITAIADDQFGDPMPLPSVNWVAWSGTVDQTGLFTSPSNFTEPATVMAQVGTFFADATINPAPTIAVPASANLDPSSGTTGTLNVLGADAFGESTLTYNWSVISAPGGANPILSSNGSNAAKSTTVTFNEPGNYSFLATITDQWGNSVTSTVNVTVNQILTSISVSPDNASLVPSQTEQLSATEYDQFGAVMATPVALDWTTVGGGSVSDSGVYTAPSNSTGMMGVWAWGGSINGAADVNVYDPAPTVAAAASASSSSVTGTTTALSVLGQDDEGESTLTYTWSVLSAPSGANPTLSANGTNAAKNTTVTFDEAGAYAFQVTITNAEDETTTSTIDVTVNQTVTTITVTAANSTPETAQTDQFTAVGDDQFGSVMTTQPSFTWSATNGTVDNTGSYTSPSHFAGTATITASAGSASGSNSVTVIALPTVAIGAMASASTVTGATTNLSVLGADPLGESTLFYKWSVFSAPTGANPTFSTNLTNAAKNTTVTFDEPGSYLFQVVISDAQLNNVASYVNVSVVSTLAAIGITPNNSSLGKSESEQLTATGYDQFGAALATQPTFSWSISGSGTIDSTGLYTAPDAVETDTVTAASDSINGSTSVSVISLAPVVSGLSVVSGPPSGGTSVTITGSYLSDATSVMFGRTQASSLTVNSDGSITAVSPVMPAQTLDVTVTNAYGTSATTSDDEFTYVSSTTVAANQAPVISTPSSLTTEENSAVTLSGSNGISISDPNTTDNSTVITVKLTATNGCVMINGDTSNLSSVVGNGTRNVSLTGTTADVDLALASVTFTPDANFSGSASLNVDANNEGVGLSGGPMSSSQTIGISVTPVTQAPINHVVTSAQVQENDQLVFTQFTAISISDANSNDTSFSVTLSAANGTLSVGGDTSTLSQITGSGTSTVALAGTISAINTALSTMTYSPDQGYTGTDSVQVVSTDLGTGDAGGPLSTTSTISIDVSATWAGLGSTSSVPTGNTTTSSSMSDYQSALSSAQTALESAITAAQSTETSAGTAATAANTSALAAALSAVQAAAADANSDNSSAVATAQAALATAWDALGSVSSELTFDGFVWPDAPPTLNTDFDGTDPGILPDWTGPTYDYTTDTAYTSGYTDLQTTYNTATAAANTQYTTDTQAAQSDFYQSFTAAAADLQAAQNEAYANYQDQVSETNEYADDLTSAQSDYLDAIQQAADDYNSAISDANAQASSAQQEDYADTLGSLSSGAIDPDYANANCEYTEDLAGIDNSLANAQESASLDYQQAVESAMMAVSQVEWEYSDWAQANSNDASNTLALADAAAQQAYAGAVAEAQDTLDRANGDATETLNVALATAAATFDEDAAQLQATTTAEWAATTGDPSSVYQSQLTSDAAADAVANDEAQLVDVIGNAQLIQSSAYATADATQTRTDSDAQATYNRTASKIEAQALEQNAALQAEDSQRQAAADDEQDREETIGEAFQTYVEGAADAQETYTDDSAVAYRDLEVADYKAGHPFDPTGTWEAEQEAGETYDAAMLTDWKTYANDSIDLNAAYEVAADGAGTTYQKAIITADTTAAQTMADAQSLGVAMSALADATYNADLADAQHAFDLSSASAQLLYTQSNATLTDDLITAQATNDADQSVQDTIADQTYQDSVMSQYVSAVQTWASSLDSGQSAWGQYEVALAQSEQSETAATETAEVQAAESSATSDVTAATAEATAQNVYDNATAQQDYQFNVAVADATHTRDVAKAYAAFDAIAGSSGDSYGSDMSVDFANQYDAAFAPIGNAGNDALQAANQQLALDSAFDKFQAAIIPLAVTEAHADVSATYDMDSANLDLTYGSSDYDDAVSTYNSDMQEASNDFRSGYVDLVAQYRQTVADLTLQPDPSSVNPPTDPEPLNAARQAQLDAADLTIDADADYDSAVANAGDQSDLDSATATQTYSDAASEAEEQDDISAAGTTQVLNDAFASAQATEEINAGTAENNFQIASWTNLVNTEEANPNDDPTALNAYNIQIAEDGLAGAESDATSLTNYLTQSTNADLQLAQSEDQSDETLATVEATAAYTANIASDAAVADNSVALANSENTMLVGDDGEIGVEAQYRKNIAADEIEYQQGADASYSYYQSEVKLAEYTQASTQISLQHDYDDGDSTADDLDEQWQDAASTANEAMASAWTDYVGYAGEFYVDEIQSLGQADTQYAAGDAAATYESAISEQTADDTLASAELSIGATERSTDANAVYADSVAAAADEEDWNSSVQEASVNYTTATDETEITTATSDAQANATYQIADAQDAVTAATGTDDPYQMAQLEAYVGWLQSVAPGYVQEMTATATANATADEADAAADQTFEDATGTAGYNLAVTEASATKDETINVGAADDTLAAAEQDATSTLNDALALADETSYVNSAQVQANYAVSVAEINANYDNAYAALSVSDVNAGEDFDWSDYEEQEQELAAEERYDMSVASTEQAASLGDVSVQWAEDASTAGVTQVTADATAQVTNATTIASIDEADSGTVASAEQTNEIAMANAQATDWVADAQATQTEEESVQSAESSFFVTEEQENEVAAEGIVSSLSSSDTAVPSDWADFLVAYQTAQATWASDQVTPLHDLATAEGGLQVAYAQQEGTDYVTMVTTSAQAATTDDAADALAAGNLSIATVTADGTYAVTTAEAEQAYRISLAEIERQYEVSMAQATADPETESGDEYAAEQEDSADLNIAALQYALAEGSANMTDAQTVATAQVAAEQAVTTADSTAALAQLSASQTYANSQANNEDTLQVQTASLQASYAISAQQSFEAAIETAAAASPGAYATYAVAAAEANLTSVTAIVQADQTYANTTAQANLTLTLANIASSTQYATTTIAANASSAMSSANAAATYLVDLATAHELLTTSGAADPPLLLALPDDPLLAGGGEALAQLTNDLSFRMNPQTWYDGYAYSLGGGWVGYDYYGEYYGSFANSPYEYDPYDNNGGYTYIFSPGYLFQAPMIAFGGAGYYGYPYGSYGFLGSPGYLTGGMAGYGPLGYLGLYGNFGGAGYLGLDYVNPGDPWSGEWYGYGFGYGYFDYYGYGGFWSSYVGPGTTFSPTGVSNLTTTPTAALAADAPNFGIPANAEANPVDTVIENQVQSQQQTSSSSDTTTTPPESAGAAIAKIDEQASVATQTAVETQASVANLGQTGSTNNLAPEKPPINQVFASIPPEGITALVGAVLTVGPDNVGHHWVPQSVSRDLKGILSKQAMELFENGTTSPIFYDHRFDTWVVTHAEYNKAVTELLKHVAGTGKISGAQAKEILNWIINPNTVPLSVKKALGEKWTNIVTWRTGFMKSIAIAEAVTEFAKSIGVTLPAKEAKAIASAMINGVDKLPAGLKEAYSTPAVQTVIKAMQTSGVGKLTPFLRAAVKKIVPALGIVILTPTVINAGQQGAAGNNPVGATGAAGASIGVLDAVAQEVLMRELVESALKETVVPFYEILQGVFLPPGKYSKERTFERALNQALGIE